MRSTKALAWALAATVTWLAPAADARAQECRERVEYHREKHSRAWSLYTVDARNAGVPPPIVLHSVDGRSVIVCGHEGDPASDGRYCKENVEHEWVVVCFPPAGGGDGNGGDQGGDGSGGGSGDGNQGDGSSGDGSSGDGGSNNGGDQTGGQGEAARATAARATAAKGTAATATTGTMTAGGVTAATATTTARTKTGRTTGRTTGALQGHRPGSRSRAETSRSACGGDRRKATCRSPGTGSSTA